jgi:hypothetical protein
VVAAVVAAVVTFKVVVTSADVGSVLLQADNTHIAASAVSADLNFSFFIKNLAIFHCNYYTIAKLQNFLFEEKFNVNSDM